MSEVDRHYAIITMRVAGLRTTMARLIILGILTKHYVMTPAKLTSHLVQYGISHTTVYRSLKALKKANLVHDVSRDGKANIELTQRMGRHTHIMFCTQCSWKRAFQSQVIEKTITSIAAHGGLVAATHEITIRGKCRECRKNNQT